MVRVGFLGSRFAANPAAPPVTFAAFVGTFVGALVPASVVHTPPDKGGD